LFYSLLLGAVDYLKGECPLDGLQNNSLDKKSKDFLMKRLKRNAFFFYIKYNIITLFVAAIIVSWAKQGNWMKQDFPAVCVFM